MLRETYNMTKGWDRRYKLDASKISESDRWAYVFWYYNRGGRVRFDYHRFRGQAEPYSRELSKNSTRTGRYENSQYVVKLLGIRAAIAHMHAQDWFDHPSKRVNLAKTAPTPPGKKKSVGGTANTAPTPTEKKKSPGDLAYERYSADKATLGWKRQLERLGDVADLYEREAAAAGKTPERDDDAWADGALEAISAEMSAIRQAHAAELKTNLAQNGISTEVAIGDKGEPSISVKIERKNAKGKVEKIEEIDAAPVDYVILPGDRIDDIAKRLSGDVNRWRLAKRIIANLNPDIANIDLIRIGQTIQVPGEYITVPNMSLKKLVAEYYPNVPEGDAIQYLKYLNGLNHNRGDVINVGDVILVPAIR